MYIFNPEHDLCLANGDIHFVPPESALAFGRDCASITRFMYGLDREADCDIPPLSPTFDKGEVKKIFPWGWNKVLCNRLLKEGYSQHLLPSNGQLAAITELSDRRVALKALEYVAGCNNGLAVNCHDKSAKVVSPGYRIAARSLEEVEQFLEKERNVVLKAPLSGSGKGIRFVSGALSHSDAGWCRNLIGKHGCVVVEKRLKPVLEFAMLFRCFKENGNGTAEFVGYSLFYTENGMYRGNILASDGWIENQIVKYVPKENLDIARNLLINFLREKIAKKYEGYVGIDQFAYLPYGIEQSSGTFEYEEGERIYGYNPVVEINLRMTMGLLAHNIYRLRENLHTCTTKTDGLEKITDGSHYFEICRAKRGSTEHYSYLIGRIK